MRRRRGRPSRCSTCRGHGTRPCVACKGRKSIQGLTCTVCSGRGWTACSTCEGTGEVR